MNLSFKNQNVFISGGTHGIGMACALKFAELGANIITFSRDKKKILFLKKKLKPYKIKILIEEGDVLNKNFVENFSKRVLSKFKNINILIHNVGGGGRWGKNNFISTDFKVWEDVYNKNNQGLILFSKFFLPTMIKNKWGRVIAVGSVCGKETRSDDRPWFNAAKAAQNAIIKSFSKKKTFTKKNITFNSISPGPIFIKDTGWDELKKNKPQEFKKIVKNDIFTKNMGKPDDVANLILFISSKFSNYINGTNLIIDGGLSNSN